MKKLIIILLLLLIPNICFASLNTHSIDLESESSQTLSITDALQTGLDLTSDFTIELWVKPESQPAADDVYYFVTKYLGTGNQRSYFFAYRNNSGAYQLGMNLSADGVETEGAFVNQTLNNATWYHVAVTWDASASTYKYYVNGSQSGSDVVRSYTSVYNGTAVFYIGGFAAGDTFDGLIDEVRIWNDIRTQPELAASYQSELTGTETNLVGYWQLDNSLLDETVNNNDLTNNNSAVFSTTVPFAGSEAGSPCSYSGTGDWYVYYSDDCTITSDVYVNGACYFVKNAAGYFGLQADISCSGKKEVGYGFNIEQKYGSEITVRY